MAPKSILKKTSSTTRPTPGGRTASGKRVRPGQNHRKAAAAEKDSTTKKAIGQGGKGRFDKPKPSGKYEKYTGPGEYTGPTGGNAGPLGKGASATAAKSGGKGQKSDGKGKKSVTLAMKKKVQGEEDEDVDMSDGDDNDFGNDDADGDDDEDEGAGTDEEIARASGKGSKSSSSGNKRKRQTTASQFGDTLTSLLAESSIPTPKTSTSASTTEAPKPKKSKAGAQQPILSLSKAKLPPSRSALALERRAEEAVKKAKTERVEKARVTDVMEGWAQPGGSQEFERGLRKVAQRGVIKLFNAILSASKVNEEGQQSLADQVGFKDEKTRRKEKDNILGRGGKEVLTKENFLDMVRQG